jgi:hypothetical protein
MSSIFYELGPNNSHRSYRMSIKIFWRLCEIIDPYLTTDNRYKNATPNGVIETPVKISIALRYFAGGSPLDIALVHGISYLEVMKIVWHMVEVINRVPELAIVFPESHEAQLQVADGFKKK